MSNVLLKWIHAPLVSQRMVSWAQLGAPAIKLELETIQSRLPVQCALGSYENTAFQINSLQDGYSQCLTQAKSVRK